MRTNNIISGFTTVCDWEHDGDYGYYQDILTSIDGVRITDRESHGDGNTAYIYFECCEEAIVPLLQNQELESIHINYDYSKLIPEDFAQGIEMLQSEIKFIPARLLDKMDTPLSWRYNISYKTYLCKFKDKADFMKMLARLNLSPTHICKRESGFILFGTGTLDSLVNTMYSDYTGNLSYYFTNRRYTDDEFRYNQLLEKVIRLNFKEVIYLPDGSKKGKLSTPAEENNKRMAEELAKLDEYLSHFFEHRKELTQYYQIDYTGSTEQTLIIEIQKPEGIKFSQLVCPFTVSKLKADKKVIELTDTDGQIHRYLSGSKKICSQKFHYYDETSPMTEHDVFMGIIFGINIEYFY